MAYASDLNAHTYRCLALANIPHLLWSRSSQRTNKKVMHFCHNNLTFSSPGDILIMMKGGGSYPSMAPPPGFTKIAHKERDDIWIPSSATSAPIPPKSSRFILKASKTTFPKKKHSCSRVITQTRRRTCLLSLNKDFRRKESGCL